jgi:hypothetical protein
MSAHLTGRGGEHRTRDGRRRRSNGPGKRGHATGAAVAIVAYGVGRDIRGSAVKATVITLAVLAMVVLSGVMIPEVRRRVRVRLDPQPQARLTAAVIGLIILVTLVTVFTAIALVAARVPYPVTIACAAGGAVLVIAGPLVNRYLHKLMLAQARQQMGGAPQAGGTP